MNKNVERDPYINNYDNYYSRGTENTRSADEIKDRVNNLVNENIRGEYSDAQRPHSYVEIKLGYADQGGYDLNHRKQNQSQDHVIPPSEKTEIPSFSAEYSSRSFVDKDGRVLQMTPQEYKDYLIGQSNDKIPPTFVEDNLGIKKYPQDPLGQDAKSSSPAEEKPTTNNDQPETDTSKTPPPNSDTPNDTGTAKRGKQEEKAKDAKKEWDEKKSDPNAKPEEKQKAKEKFFKEVDEFLEQDQKDNAHSEGYTKQTVDKLNNVADSCRNKIQKANEQIAAGQKHQQKAENKRKAAENIEKQLGNDKIEITDKKGIKKTIGNEEAKKIAKGLKGESKVHRAKGDKMVFSGKTDAAFNGALGSAAKEAGKQITDAKYTYGSAVALGGIDSAFDLIEGKCDLKTAAKNTVWNSATGSATYAVASVGYEGVKGAITATVTNGAEKLPALGTVMKVCQVSSMVYNAQNATEALDSLWNFGVDVGGEAALLTGITFATGGTGLVPMVGAKIAWRSLKYGWSYLV